MWKRWSFPKWVKRKPYHGTHCPQCGVKLPPADSDVKRKMRLPKGVQYLAA